MMLSAVVSFAHTWLNRILSAHKPDGESKAEDFTRTQAMREAMRDRRAEPETFAGVELHGHQVGWTY